MLRLPFHPAFNPAGSIFSGTPTAPLPFRPDHPGNSKHQGLTGDKVCFAGQAKDAKSEKSHNETSDGLMEVCPSGSHFENARSSSSSASSVSAPGLSPVRLAEPQLTLPEGLRGLERVPQLTRRQVEFRPDRLMDRVPMGDRLKLVSFADLERVELLPRYAVQLPSFQQPLLSSRLIRLDRDREGCILYVPGPQGRYIPRPVYQSASHGAWQTPNFILRGWDRTGTDWRVKYFGKGETPRYKMQTALKPDVQAFLSDIQQREPVKADVTPDEINALVGTTYNCHSPDERFEQWDYHQHLNLEDLYRGSRIDSPRDAKASSKISLLPARRFQLPDEARPDFCRQPMVYELQNRLYGQLRAEVYPSKDDQLLWTYHVQPGTNRAWVAFAHMKDSPVRDTGLPLKIVNIGDTIALAPYEHRAEFGRWNFLPIIPGTQYADIWKKYTSKGPLVQDYYKAKGMACPP